MFRFNHDDAAFSAAFDNVFFHITVFMGPKAVRIIQKLESIRATFLYYQETGIPLVTSFHKALRQKVNCQSGSSGPNSEASDTQCGPKNKFAYFNRSLEL